VAPSIPGPFGPFWLPSSDNPQTLENAKAITEEVWAGEYEHPELPADVGIVIDIGAGWGAFATWARKKWGPVTLIGFEPHVAAAALYRKNVPWSHLSEVAVTVEPNPKFYVDQYWSGGHTHDRTEGVQVAALHPKDLPYAHVLKCDAEGVEAEVLEHYPHIQSLLALLIEWHTPALKAECHALVAQRTGFRCLREETERGYGVSLWVPRKAAGGEDFSCSPQRP
jgi:FkbM family methyltransferase